jgi:serine/threonine protein kinase
MSEVPPSEVPPSEVPPSKVPPYKKYVSKEKIGSGATCKAYIVRVIQPDGSFKRFLMKELLDPKYERLGLIEAEIMGRIPHNHLICQLNETFLAPNGRRVIVMEFCEGVDLQKYLQTCVKAKRRIASQKIMEIMAQIFAAIAHLHEHRIFHGDIKPANIMLDEKDDGTVHIKIIDFGMSSHFDAIIQRVQGSPLYFSPEIAHQCRKAHEKKEGYTIDHRSDIWALGVVMLDMLSDDDKPFFLHAAKKRDDVEEILRSLSFDRTPFPQTLLQNEDPNVCFLARIAQRCLSLDKLQRPTARQIFEELTCKIAELVNA